MSSDVSSNIVQISSNIENMDTKCPCVHGRIKEKQVSAAGQQGLSTPD